MKQILHHFGVEISRYPGRAPGNRRVKLLQHHKIDVVVDVGANDGGYALEIREFGYRGRIVSFEPLSEPYGRLVSVSSSDPLWTTVRAAVGNETGIVTINVAGNSTSSSILLMREAHRLAAPTSRYVRTERVPIVRLDDEWGDHVPSAATSFLKVDTQGFEREVLDGAGDAVLQLRGVQLEMSLVELYEGSMLFEEALERLTAAGFELQSVEPGFSDAETGRLLQVDGIFFRKQ